MKKKRLLTAALSMVLLCMTASPVSAGQWLEDNNSNWRYYSDNGNMVTGWIEDNGNWYFLTASGNMATGWIKDDEHWYYLYDDGAMAHDTWIDKSYVNSSGRWVKNR